MIEQTTTTALACFLGAMVDWCRLGKVAAWLSLAVVFLSSRFLASFVSCFPSSRGSFEASRIEPTTTVA